MKKNKSEIPLIIIPVRMGSKRLKNKNILPIKGLPMFVFVAKEVQKSKFSPLIYVSSESVKIQNICKRFNINFVKRPKKLSLSYKARSIRTKLKPSSNPRRRPDHHCT